MSTRSNNIQFSPYLLDQRKFPDRDLKELATQNDLSYVEVARAVNSRTIGITPTNFSVATGEKWYISTGPTSQSSLRQVYSLTGAGNIAHGIDWTSVGFISPKSYGSYTDGTNWYGVMYGSSTAIAGQVSFYITSTNIVVLVDAGAPAVTSGYILLEWVSQI